MKKLTSRKFWISVAAMLASIGSAIVGVATDNATLTTVGAACTALSAGIYAFCEAWVDKSAAANTIADGIVIGDAAAQTGLVIVDEAESEEE